MVRRAASLAALGLALALTACADGPPVTNALLPTEHYGVQVTSAPDQLALGLHSEGLTTTQQAAIGQFVAEWRDDGGGVVSVRAPTSGDTALARRMAEATVAYVEKMGVPQELVRLDGYAPAGAGPAVAAPVLVVYDRFQAVGPDCSHGWDNLTATGSNRIYGHFGCAATANLAAMVANPRDLLAPAVTMPADDSRREVVLGKYRQGVSTSTAADQQASGKVSDTAN